jgi:hypothetical protein
VALELALNRPELVRKLVLVNSLGLGRPSMQLTYGLITLPRVGEAFMKLAGDALQWAPARMIRSMASRYVGSSADLKRTMDDDYFANLRELYAADGYQDAYLSTVRSLITPKALLGADYDLSRRLPEIKLPVQLIWGADDPLFPVAHAARAHSLIRHSRLAVIEGAGHTPQAERPEEFNRVLDNFPSTYREGSQDIHRAAVPDAGRCPARSARPSIAAAASAPLSHCPRLRSMARSEDFPGQDQRPQEHPAAAVHHRRQPSGMVRPGVHHSVLS